MKRLLSRLNTRVLVILVLAGLSLTLTIIRPIMAEPAVRLITSYRYIMVYGSGDLAVGDVIEFFDPEGTLCGRCLVEEAGGYGMVAVYGDDPQTTEIDEGAREGDYLTVRVNGREVYPVGSPPVWEKDGELQRIDL